MVSSAATAAPGGDGWRDALRGYLPGAPVDAAPHSEPARDRTPLALQFELRELIGRHAYRWNGPVSRAAEPAAGPLRRDHRLGVRPVARTARGWARTGITWTNIPHLINRLNLDRDQHRWFCELGALHRALGSTTPGRDPDWVYLDEFANPVLWTLLEQTPTLGVRLVGVGSGADIRLAGPAGLGLDAVRNGAGIRVGPLLTIGDSAVDVTHARAIGTHGIYLIDPAAPRRIMLAPTVEPLSPEQLDILGGGTAVTAVPAPDVQEFLATFLPQLQARIQVGSSDASVDLPPPQAPLLVESPGTAPDHRELTGTPQLVITTVPSERPDWFDLGVTVTVDGRTIPYLPLFQALANGRRRLLLVDGSYLRLDHPALTALAELIAESRDLTEWEPVPSLSRHQISLWSDFEDLADQAVPAVQWRALLAETRNDAPRPVDPPRGLTAELRPYQQEGFSWLAYLWRHQLGGILADDMGLGKTLQCLALVQHVVESGIAGGGAPFLIVAPTSVMTNWVSESARFTPALVVRQVSATETSSRISVATVADGADIVVTSYALLRLDFEAYQAVAQSGGWSGLVLDEAQFVKNPGSKVHSAALDLQVRFKLAVTGTPLENSLTDLQAIFAVVAPGLFPSAPRFFNDYVRPIEAARPGIASGAGAGNAVAVNAAVRSERLTRLRRRIQPFLLRRNKDLVAADLPAKQEQTLHIDLAPEHRDLYELFLQRERQKLFRLLGEDLDLNKFTVLRSLTLLRLLALDASLIGDEYANLTSSKLDALLDQLDDVVSGGHRALVFSQFTSYLAKVAHRLDAAGIAYGQLDGSTRKRGTVIDEFKTGTAPVFLISLKAGGFGLNLTEADYVFLLDPWWNPASEEQAIDRTHRIGQHRQVMVYRLVATDTIEEKVLALQERKSRLFDAVIDDGSLFSAPLSADDIRELLS